MAAVTINGAVRQLTAGTLLSDALGHDISMPCGGRGRCGKCRVYAAGALSPLTAEERAALTVQELADGIRLACCTRIEGDAAVTTPDAHAITQICTDADAGAAMLSPLFSVLGAAVDVGTTTLAAQLYDASGLLATASARNPQSRFGADVISRVGSAIDGHGAALAGCIRDAISDLLSALCREAGRQTREIDGLVITGNTAMLHLLTQTDPAPLAAAPFNVRERFGKFISAAELALPCAENARVYLPRCISAFVGADITTAILASGLCEDRTTALLVDIGTNGEMALWHTGKLLCCSTAAGPAFEGANLSQGMQGAPGAIDHAEVVNGALALHTIADAEAAGICGSGVMDVLACLLDMDILDETGLLDDGEDSYALTDTVSVTQADVRQVQLAKSAIRAGLETLLHRAGLTAQTLPALIIAGGFGSFLRLDSAAKIGLLPRVLVHKSRVIGNAALAGAAMLLGNTGRIPESEALADNAVTAELSSDPQFSDFYMEYMMF